jgi:hypothetical protein
MQYHGHLEFVRLCSAVERKVAAGNLIVLDTMSHMAWLSRRGGWTLSFQPKPWPPGLNVVESFFSKMTGHASATVSFARSRTCRPPSNADLAEHMPAQNPSCGPVHRRYPDQTRPPPLLSVRATALCRAAGVVYSDRPRRFARLTS